MRGQRAGRTIEMRLTLLLASTAAAAATSVAADADQRRQRRRRRNAARKGAAAARSASFDVVHVVGGVVEARMTVGAAISGVEVERRCAAGGD